MKHWASQMGGAGHAGHFAHVGRVTGLDETFDKANQANRHGPELRAFDRYGSCLAKSADSSAAAGNADETAMTAQDPNTAA